MLSPTSRLSPAVLPAPRIIFELLKPITWFPPMWAFACGLISSGVPLRGHLATILTGIVLCGPLLCATSQAVNDWFDRHVDAINEPNRPIPSGRMPGRTGLYVSILWSVLSLACASALGRWVLCAAMVGLALAWAYSAPPIRLKRNGWWGNLACAVCYEGFAWVTGAAVMLQTTPPATVFAAALLYSLGAHGIMTLNDFKSIAGDRQAGVGSLPVRLGPERAAMVACIAMIVPQIIVVVMLSIGQRPYYAVAIAIFSAVQVLLMKRLLTNPRKLAPWYNGTGVSLYVSGMMVCAFASRGIFS